MDIPDLPQGAFEHCGDGKIKPQGGGGGGIVSAITDPISDVLGTSGGGGGILGAVEDVGQAIGDVGESFDKSVTQPIGQGLSEVDQFVNREIPGGWITPAAVAAAVAAPYLAPALLGEGAAAAGAAEAAAALEAAAAAEGATTAGMVAAANTGLPAGTATLADLATVAASGAAETIGQALPYTEAFDAVNLANQGLGAEQIAQNLTISVGTDPFIAQDIATMAANGLSPEAIVQNLQYSYSASELAPLGLESKAATLASSLISPAMAMQGLRLAGGLLSSGALGGGGGRQQPQMPQMAGRNMQYVPQGAVDYSGIYNLLGLQRAKNPNSLLG
jgi:hypothetical protein